MSAILHDSRPLGEGSAHVAPPGPALTEFQLFPSVPPRPHALRHENPFCVLAARTTLGARFCGRGCGIAGEEREHACPFGLEMRRAADRAADGSGRWVGRRFTSARALHLGLDLLTAEGIDPEHALAHLPDNPIVTAPELDEAAAHLSPLPRPQSAEDDGRRLAHVLEYVDQVRALVAAPGNPDEICGRFLRVLTGVLPFAEMTLYLDGPHGLTPCASVGGPADPENLAAAAFDRVAVLVETPDGTFAPASEQLEPPPAAAIPLLAGSAPLGVWFARRGSGAPLVGLVSAPLALMRLLAGMLAERLAGLEQAAAPAVIDLPLQPPAQPFAEELAREVARSVRMSMPLAALRLRVAGRGDISTHEPAISAVLRDGLRPYDRVFPAGGGAWDIIATHLDAEGAQSLAARLVERIEDLMDQRGGVEELGLRFAVGYSVWADDAAVAEELAEHAAAATELPPAGTQIRHYRPPRLDANTRLREIG